MILEGLLCVGTVYSAYRYFGYDIHSERKLKREVKKRWNTLMDSMGHRAENKIYQEYEILKIVPKHYGFDAVISLPFSKKFLDIVNLIPSLESCFKSNVISSTTDDKNTAYLRFHFVNREISQKDKLKFDWFKTFYNIDGCMTKTGETLKITSMEEIESPSDEVVGYKVNSKIPIGLSYDKIKNSYDTITKTLGKCFLNFNYKSMELETSIIHVAISDESKFKSINVKPWELYVAMGYDWKPIILDYSLNANCLIGGIQGSGKTNALISAFINLCSKCNGETYSDSFDLMVCNIGEKNDLRVFRDVKQCKYYANNESEALSMIKYLKKEMDRRNKLFSKQKEFCFNIHQYNKLVKDESKQLKVIHLIADEVADLMNSAEIQKLLWDLIRKSRSSGIYITTATQRGSLENMSSEIKGQLANKISFSQPNTASALTIMSGEDVAKRVMSLEKKRECLVDYMEGIKVAKTLYLDERMMEEFLNDVIVDDSNKLILDLEGNIVEFKVQKSEQKVIDIEQKSGKKDNKNSRFVNFIKDKKVKSK